MKSWMISVLALSWIAGCALESDAQEATTEQDLSVTPSIEFGRNFIRVCSGVALRSCDSKASCDTGVRLDAHGVVISDFEDTARDTAHLTSPPGWIAVHSPSGLLTISSVDGPCR